MLEGRIARLGKFPGSFVRSRGISLRNQKFTGTPVQNLISNSICVLLILVNYVENRRKIGKMQTQFCWIPGEKLYNFS
jgi:hypothetical protein